MNESSHLPYDSRNLSASLIATNSIPVPISQTKVAISCGRTLDDQATRRFHLGSFTL